MYAVSLLIFGLIALIHAKRPVFGEDMEEILEMIHNECVEATGVAENDISNCYNGIFKNDPKLKCYMFCLLEEANLVEEGGVVNFDLLISFLPAPYDTAMIDGIDKCKKHDTMDKDNCQRAFDVHSCLYEADPEHYFIF